MLNSYDTAVVEARSASALALQELGLLKLGKKCQEIFDVCLAAQRGGRAADFSLNEIRELYEAQYQRRIDVGRVSARVSELVAAKRLVRATARRACLVTGFQCQPVSVPPEQARLCA